MLLRLECIMTYIHLLMLFQNYKYSTYEKDQVAVCNCQAESPLFGHLMCDPVVIFTIF